MATEWKVRCATPKGEHAGKPCNHYFGEAEDAARSFFAIRGGYDEGPTLMKREVTEWEEVSSG